MSARGSPTQPVTHDEIARRAFELYISRDGHEGDALADWFRAEQELGGMMA